MVAEDGWKQRLHSCPIPCENIRLVVRNSTSRACSPEDCYALLSHALNTSQILQPRQIVDSNSGHFNVRSVDEHPIEHTLPLTHEVCQQINQCSS